MAKRPEILAPAGDEPTILEALRAGADAVYFGLNTGFNARVRAENVAVERLPDLMGRIHELGKRGYLALNTLVFDGELDRLGAMVECIADAGVDAVIVQDLGVARWLRGFCPSLRLHASTQMTCTDAGSVELARSLGVSRVTLARELPLSEIGALVEASTLELEAFAHGALCVSYSGQCLTSEAIGGRSANRGACAQACRLPYDVLVDGLARDLGDRVYLLSPKDLDSSRRIPELIQTGVSAIKIEGRLKSADYVCATTYLYRRAVDAALGLDEPLDEREREASSQTFSRGACYGFLDGTNHQALVDGKTCDHVGVEVGECLSLLRRSNKTWMRVVPACSLQRGDGLLLAATGSGGEIGGRIWALSRAGQEIDEVRPGEEAWLWLGPERMLTDACVGRRVYRTSSPRIVDEALAAIARRETGVSVTARLSGRAGQAARLSLSTEDGRHVEVTLKGQLEFAKNRPLDEATARDKLGRLGDTPYRLTELAFELEPGTTLALSALNQARRDAVEQLFLAARRQHPLLVERAWSEGLAWPTEAAPPEGLFVTCRDLVQARAALDAGASGVYLDFLALAGVGAALRQLRLLSPKVFVGVALPRIRRKGDEKIDQYVRGLRPDALLVRSLGSLRDLETQGTALSTPNDATTDSAVSETQRESRPLVIADFSLNVANSLSALEVLRRKAQAFTPSYDLDMAQLQALLDSPLAPYAEVVVHHPMPLFHTEHCLMAALLSSGKDHRDCGRPCEQHELVLRDRTGLVLPVVADVTCRNTIFHGKAQSAMDGLPHLRHQGVRRFRLELLREGPDETRVLVEGYRELLTGACAPVQLRQRLGAAGLDVIQGSLRVVG